MWEKLFKVFYNIRVVGGNLQVVGFFFKAKPCLLLSNTCISLVFLKIAIKDEISF